MDPSYATPPHVPNRAPKASKNRHKKNSSYETSFTEDEEDILENGGSNPKMSPQNEKPTNDPIENADRSSSSPDKDVLQRPEKSQNEEQTNDSIENISISSYESSKNLSNDSHNKEPKWDFSMIAILSAIVVIVACATVHFARSGSGPSKEATDRQTCRQFLQLRSKYPKTNGMLWPSLMVGVERALNHPGEPSTFVFLHNSSSAGSTLVDDITEITIQCFGNNDAIRRTSSDYQSPEVLDYSVALEQHRKQLISRGVLVVRDLDRIPPNAAKLFFSICDSYEPLVRKAVIFFTMEIPQHLDVGSFNSSTSIAEDILKNLWRKEMDLDQLDPLLVRLTENVFKID